MPKCYSEHEKAYIKQRLKDEAYKCLAQYGIRRTTVDEIVKRVKIPKGTFYLFYQSKELLLFDVILEQHDLIEKEIYKAFGSLKPDEITVSQLTEILFKFYKAATEMTVFKMLNFDEIELLARKLPQAVLEQHLGHDESMIDTLFSAFPIKPGMNPKVFSTAFRAIYFSTLHKEEIGEENFDESLRYLIRGLVMQLL